MSAAGLKRWRRGGGGRRKVVLAGAGKHTLRSIARTWRVQSAWLHKREQAGHISAATGRPCRAKQLECHAGLRGEAAAAATWGLAPGATGRQCCTCGGYAGGPGGGEREEAHESAQASKHSLVPRSSLAYHSAPHGCLLPRSPSPAGLPLAPGAMQQQHKLKPRRVSQCPGAHCGSGGGAGGKVGGCWHSVGGKEVGCADGGGTDVCSMTVEVARNDGGAGGGGGKVGTGARCWLVIDAGSRHWHKVRGVVLSHGVGGGSGGEVGGATGAHLQGWRWERANMHTRTKHAARQLVASDTLVTPSLAVTGGADVGGGKSTKRQWSWWRQQHRRR